ncbi:hypothetical protein BDV06DRAFT_225905 [Aspergillus oleicola]
MLHSRVFIHALLLSKATAAFSPRARSESASASIAGQGGWKNGPKATGFTDPDVTANCDYWVNDVQSSDTCEMVDDYFDITLRQLVSWNPSLQYDYCVLVPGMSYCVSGPAVASTSAIVSATPASTVTFSGTAAPVQSSVASSCTKYHYVRNGDSCNSIQDQYMNFTLAQFYTWNPSIKEGCKGLVQGDYVCVAAKSPTTASSSSSSFPTQSGATSKCNKWHFVAGDDTCSSIRDQYDLTATQFYNWNPMTGSKCTNLWRKTYVCVGIPGSSSIPATTTATPTATTAPSPVQSGITKACTKYYKVKSGDTCEAVEKDHNVSASDFNKWNPAVGKDCSDLEKGAYVCVAV